MTENDVARIIFSNLFPCGMCPADWDSGAILGPDNCVREQFLTAARALLSASIADTAGICARDETLIQKGAGPDKGPISKDFRTPESVIADTAGAKPVAWISTQQLKVLAHNAVAAVSPPGMRDPDDEIPLYVAPQAPTAPPAPSVALCTICNGYGRYQDGHSGRESDGYAPNIVECECAEEERRQECRQPSPSIADAAGASKRIAELEDALSIALAFIDDATIEEGQWHWLDDVRAAIAKESK